MILDSCDDNYLPSKITVEGGDSNNLKLLKTVNIDWYVPFDCQYWLLCTIWLSILIGVYHLTACILSLFLNCIVVGNFFLKLFRLKLFISSARPRSQFDQLNIRMSIKIFIVRVCKNISSTSFWSIQRLVFKIISSQ